MEPNKGSEVEVFTSPWVSGTRAAAYFGPISATKFVPNDKDGNSNPDEWQEAQLQVIRDLQDKSLELGGNAVVGVDITANPFFTDTDGVKGLLLEIMGTSAILEPLF